MCVRVTERDGKGDGRDGERAQKDSCEISHREEDERGGVKDYKGEGRDKTKRVSLKQSKMPTQICFNVSACHPATA